MNRRTVCAPGVRRTFFAELSVVYVCQDAVAGTMWRAGNSHTPLTGMFAVSARALGILVEHGDVPAWPYDPDAGVVSGRATAVAERVGYWNSAYAMSLLRGARRLLFDANTRLIFGGLRAAPQPTALVG